MKTKFSRWGIFFSLTTFVGCTQPLLKSEVDLSMRFQGTYSCDLQNSEYEKEPQDPLAKNIKSTQIKCHKDKFQFNGNKVVFFREYFNKKDCSEKLGEIALNGQLQGQNVLFKNGNESFEFRKLEPSWVFQEEESCTLHALAYDQTVKFNQIKNCSFAKKVWDLQKRNLKLDVIKREGKVESAYFGFKAYGLNPVNKITVCQRYPQDSQ